MNTYVKTKGNAIALLWDRRDPRYRLIIDSLIKQGHDLVEIEITDEQIDAYISGKAFDVRGGKAIPHEPTFEEVKQQVCETRAQVIGEIEARDKSEAVNSFSVGGLSMWLDRETRAGLARAIETDKTLGSEMTVIWHEGPPPVRFNLPIEMAEGMLLQLEAYAKATYNTTQAHIAAVYALETAPEIEAYDYTAGYPPKLVFSF